MFLGTFLGNHMTHEMRKEVLDAKERLQGAVRETDACEM